MASLKRERERERESPESRQTACAACVLCGRPTVATRMSQKGAITTVISCLQNDKSNPPAPHQKKNKQNSVVTGPLWETADDRKFSQRFSIKCVCFEVCARRRPPPTLVLQSIPNNRLGNFPEIWIRLIAHWFWILFARCGSQSKQPGDIPCSP